MAKWTTLQTKGAPHARHENGFAAIDQQLYLFGGRRVQPVDVFDPQTSTWTHLNPPPTEIHHFQPVVIDRELWLLGTMTGVFPRETPLETVCIFNPEKDSWRSGLEIPQNRRRGGAGCVLHEDGWIYLVGGIVDGHHSGTQPWFDRLNPKTGEWQVLPDAPHKRDHAPAVIVDNKLYYFAGRETGRHNGQDYAAIFSSTLAEVDMYDFASGEWTTLKDSIPIPTAAGGVGVIDDKIHYAGGETDRLQAFAETQLFDPASQTWSLGASMNQGRHGTNACVFNSELWIAAGCGNRGGEPELTSLERLVG